MKIPLNKKYTQAVLISLVSSIISMSLANVFFSDQWALLDTILYMLVYVGGLLGLVYYMENLRRSRILKREIINTEKLQAVSHLAASISHEVRNPLTATKGFLQLLKSDDNLSKEKKQQFIDIAISELNRAENIINDYLAFAKPSMELQETIEIQSEINKVIEIVKPLANMNAVFIQCHVPVFYVNGEKHLFQQCFVNLVKNAIESMQGGGVLILEAQQSKKVSGNFSQHVLDEITENLQQKNQVMILHNRRGYANVVECETCGHVSYCSNCDVIMTYHKFSNELKCHYCGNKSSKPSNCPKCNAENLNTRGVGVEQIHEEVSRLFPDAEVDRMDVDSMRRKFAYEKLYEKIESGETDIIVGTQMISKGLDFDHIELVTIPRADHMLYVQDFRAEERAYQLITQVSGRAGRVSGEGKVLIQTYNPQHFIFQLIRENDPREIYSYLLEERKKFNYPPYTKTILIELKHRNEAKADRASQFLGSVLRKYLPPECILGPEKSPVGKINLLYQYQILIKLPRGKFYKIYKNYIKESIEEFEEITAYRSVKRYIYVDF